MKQVINGKMYNTETATRIYGQKDTNPNLTRWETLYRKRTGEFFIVNWTRWEREKDVIEPATEATAREWLAANADGDIYEEIFGAVEE